MPFGQTAGSEHGTSLISLLKRTWREMSFRQQEELRVLQGRCQALMERGDCDAHTFSRAAKLLAKAGRHYEVAVLCRYVRDWAAWRETKYLFGHRMWLNSRYRQMIARLPELEARLATSGKS